MTAAPLDLKGLKCPLPALRLRKALASIPKGARLYVTVTDPMAVIDIPHALNETGDLLIEQSRSDAMIAFLVTRATLLLRRARTDAWIVEGATR